MNFNFFLKNFIKSPPYKLIFLLFFISVGIGIFDGIFSIFLETILVKPYLIGFVSSAVIFIMFFTYVLITNFLLKYPVVRTWSVSTIFLGISLFLLYFVTNIILIYILLALSFIFLALHFNTSLIILRYSTDLSNIGRVQGAYFSVSGIGWFIGPIISSLIIYYFGLSTNFLFIGLFIFIGWLLFLFYNIKIYEEKIDYIFTFKNFKENIYSFFKNSENLKIYFIRGSVSFYWGVIYIFVPLYILLNNLPTIFVGFYLSLAMLPLILLEFQVGKLTDTYNIKKIFIVGIIFIIFFMFLAFFINNIYLTLGFILLSVIGISFLEPTSEIYFFKNTNDFFTKRYYGILNTSDSVFGFVSRFFFGFILLFFKIDYVFLFTSIVFMFFLIIACSFKN